MEPKKKHGELRKFAVIHRRKYSDVTTLHTDYIEATNVTEAKKLAKKMFRKDRIISVGRRWEDS